MLIVPGIVLAILLDVLGEMLKEKGYEFLSLLCLMAAILSLFLGLLLSFYPESLTP